jgi:hypothetical protein
MIHENIPDMETSIDKKTQTELSKIAGMLKLRVL